MRVGRIEVSGKVLYAELADKAVLLSDAPWLGGTKTGDAVAWSEADLRAPVVPYKIACIGRNYAAHAKEMGNEPPKEPLVFFKPKTAIVGMGAAIVLPTQSAKVEHEAELGVIIGKTARNIARADALAHVFGYTCVNDVTARDLQKKDGQWARAKGFDTFCPVGPWIETSLDPKAIRVQCRVNNAIRQDASTASMIFDVATLIEYVSAAMTLEPGDLLVTGTPEGVGPLTAGDTVEVEIDGIGILRNPVR